VFLNAMRFPTESGEAKPPATTPTATSASGSAPAKAKQE
jgi:hypothetical protein